MKGKKIHVFSSHLYTKMSTDIQSVKKWTKNVDLLDCDVIFMLIFIPDHWCLCVIEPQAYEITYYDSLGGRNNHCLNRVLTYLSTEHGWKKRAGPFLFNKWKKNHASGIGSQPNSWDCGVFVCYYARMVAEGNTITDSIEWLTNRRRQMAKEILAGVLQDHSAVCTSSETVTCQRVTVPHKWESKTAGYGIKNVGQTCFAAAILQALFNCAPFVAWLLSESEMSHRKTCQPGKFCLPCVLHELYSTSLRTTVDPSALIKSLSDFWPEYIMGTQQDCHEFLIKLLENIEIQCVSRAEHVISPIQQIFGGILRYVVSCNVCKRKSITEQSFKDLPLDVTPILNNSISNFFRAEVIAGYKCVGCHQHVQCTKRAEIVQPPEVLLIQLKRFTGDGKKIKIFVKYNPTITLSSTKYSFKCAVTHVGDGLADGHYVAVAQCPDQLFRHFDDQEVSSFTLAKLPGFATKDVTQYSTALFSRLMLSDCVSRLGT
ncbi:hypothetical protein FOCC_FOCC006401 [Frankliniella occidentalis]|nr:hypothetical protein FOCC_FOCC006401 [Frankliniella occidentalis]